MIVPITIIYLVGVAITARWSTKAFLARKIVGSPTWLVIVFLILASVIWPILLPIFLLIG